MSEEESIFVHMSSDYLDRDYKYGGQILDIYKNRRDREKRVYIKVNFDSLIVLIPLREDISQLTKNRALRNCFFKAPSSTRELAGLDFTKAILVKEENFFAITGGIANSQEKEIVDNYGEIESLYISYYKRFEKSLKKNRTDRDLEFKYCVLRSFEAEIEATMGKEE